MAVGLQSPNHVLNVPGIRLATTSAGLYKKPRADVALIELAGVDSTCSAVFTQNAFAAAPIVVARKHLQTGQTHYCLINAGNANAGTGQIGMNATNLICEELAAVAGCRPEGILPFSTGVIGEPLPVDNIVSTLTPLYEGLREDGWLEAAKAIMTTDTMAKAVSKTVNLDGRSVTITGIAKGAGMIRPDMATMLAFIATNAKIEQGLLDRLLMEATEVSFNRICVDGDTSTNDACVLMATGAAPMKRISSYKSASYISLANAVKEVCVELAQAIVRDGEGATKFITIEVKSGRTQEEAQQVAYAVATSPLVKTAFFASDPNWGRILAAIGRAGIAGLDMEGVKVYLGNVLVVEGGGKSGSYTEAAGIEVMQQDDINVTIYLSRGNYRETVWTCDLSHEYVRINAEYRT